MSAENLAKTVTAGPAPRRSRPARLMLTVEEAAESLGVGRTTMYDLIKSGHVESMRIGRLRRVPADCLSAFVSALRHSQMVS